MPGILSIALTTAIVFLITHALAERGEHNRLTWAGLTGLLYASTPSVIQGALIVDIDPTILTLATILFTWCYVKYQQGQRPLWAVLTGLAFAGALWARITSPIMLAIVFTVMTLLRPLPTSHKVGSAAIWLSGAALFLSSWYVYCRTTGVAFAMPFTYTWSAFRDRGAQFSVSEFAQNLASFAFWVGLILITLFAVIVFTRVLAFVRQRTVSAEDFFLAGGIIPLVAYNLIKDGVIFGFPKYHAPALPLACIGVGVACSRSIPALRIRTGLILATVPLLGIALQVFTARDATYVLRFALREAVAFAPESVLTIAAELAVRTFLLGAGAAGILILAARRQGRNALIAILFSLALGTNLGTSLLHATAGYYTGYDHGGQGTIEAADFLRTRVPLSSLVIVPTEILHYLNLPNARSTPNALWLDTALLRKRLADPNTSAFAYSVPTNTVRQIRGIILDAELQALLAREFEQMPVGTYRIWLRKGLGDHRPAGAVATRTE